ncbi:peroxiredoxin [Candidatus Bodocaedibacter vickermanii]|uniref:Putative peroxiredoxin n=1 Tax=Candidatus Bodocaedibacter vickermanii TaxID=2741701 RepID=A0A7L9RU33_9PROT|nr:putative peroxiredoxin [Candidatus Paracaedibacteraceae bacterium 'Lake Konstanz']
MTVLVGKHAPDFKAKVVFGNETKTISLSDYKNKYVVLFFYPLDFTFVCPTEMHAFQEKLSEFKSRDVELLGCSVDSDHAHIAWLNTPKDKGGIQGIEYGIISDLGGQIAKDYDVLSDGNVAYRAVFLIDKSGIVRHQLVNDLPLGRSVEEVLRTVDALQHVEQNGEVCPANWMKGKTAMKATRESVSTYLTQNT